MSAPDSPRILILGGTAESAAIAMASVLRWGEDVSIITSLAGRTITPSAIAGEVRVGGFGGASGIRNYLRDEKILAVIDATHPFATHISENARLACEATKVPRLVFERPSWEREDGDQWHMMGSTSKAAEALPTYGQRIFLTTGRGEIAAFTPCSNIWFLVRLVDMPLEPVPLENAYVIAARGPFTVEAERALMERHKIDVLVCKASGGEMTRAKLVAARALGCPVLMISRPELLEGDRVSSVDTAVAWLSDVLT
jgi:precorrin-6A/cobalt-precorrin-6A reductase